MDNKVICACTVVALLGGAMVISVPAGPPQRGLHSDRHQGGGGSGRLRPASLDLDTCGCPTTFGQPVCEQQTSWTLDKTTNTEKLNDPDDTPFSFTVTVTEGPMEQTLTATGQIIITNSGDQTPSLASVAVLLEDLTPGAGDAPGPSGNNWKVLRVTAESEAAACGSIAVVCDRSGSRTLVQDAGSNLILFNCDDMNDVIALSDAVQIPPTVDNDGDGLRDEDPVYTGANDTANSCRIIDNDGDGLFDEDPIDGVDNDGDGLVDEDGACEDAVVFCFEAVFDISGLGIEGPGDGVVPSAADLRIDLLVTFKAGGKRGGTCSADVDCDGVLEDGKGGNPDEGEGQVRTIQQRLRFDPAACDPVCECVTLTDLGAFADDPACAEVLSTTLDEEICATGFEGTETVRDITGTVTCQPNCPPPPGEQGLYGITLGTDSLFRIDTTSGAGNLIGPLNMGFNILTVGADFACDGTLWVFSSIGNGQHLLYTVDITNGQSTTVLIYNTSGLPTVVGFEFDIDESTMLWRANRFLHRLELDSTLTLITNSLPVNSVSLTVNPDTCSDFFSEASGFLQIIASDGSVVTTVGPTLNSISSLASAPDGTLFAHAAGILYTVSKITGAALPVGPIGASTPGMAFGPLEVTCTPSCPFCEGCSTTVTNTAELTCEDDSLIEGSPASASFEVNCAGGDGHGEDFCRQTQGGWGQDSCNPGPDPCAGGNVGCFRDCHFDDLFPSGLVVGDPDGPDADGSYAILLTSSAAVAEYLPAGGMPAALTADQTDPETTSSGVFGGQLVAATLNVAVDDAGLRRDGAGQSCPAGTLGTLLYVAGCVDDDLVGLSVKQVIALANTAISGGGTPAGVAIGNFSDALALLNENFVDCDTNLGCLALPGPRS